MYSINNYRALSTFQRILLEYKLCNYSAVYCSYSAAIVTIVLFIVTIVLFIAAIVLLL